MHPFQNPELSHKERATDLLSRLTIEEKCAQMLHSTPAIERLGIPAYNWWNECLHGVARAGVASVFPQAIGLASMFDAELMHRTATVISDEARAKHHAAAAQGDYGIYRGLTYWTPNINIFRDPRWGRGQETYGECPHLTGQMGAAFVRGLQGDDDKYIKIVATPKHFAVHSGPEEKRHAFDATVDDKDLWETYLPAFRETVVEAGAWSVMGAYNRTNGEPCCGSTTLLEDILRERWGFEGYVVSDCGAIQDFHEHHKVTKTAAESAALAVKNGCDLNCGCIYTHLNESLEQGLLTEVDIDKCLIRLLEARVRLGMFDPPAEVPYASIPFDVVDSEEHRNLTLETARASIVLLKNDNALPLSKNIGTIAVIGPNANDRRALLGNYHGIPSKAVTPLEGICGKVSPNTKVLYQPGCDHLAGVENLAIGYPDRYFAEARIAASQADVVILCVGLTADMEGEQGDASNAEAAGDRATVGLPKIQERLFRALQKEGTPVVLVINSGSGVAAPEAQENAAAIVQQFYGGQEGGTALADILFGDCNPAGRLPVTVYTSMDQLPDFEDYSMKGRTYRYFEGEPLYPFGFGLSYTSFKYADIQAPATLKTGEPVEVSIEVTNDGARVGDEVIQAYISHDSPSGPIRQLVGFRRMRIAPGESRRVEFTIRPRDLAQVDNSGRSVIRPGKVRLYIGSSQPDPTSRRLGMPEGQGAIIDLEGEAVELEW